MNMLSDFQETPGEGFQATIKIPSAGDIFLRTSSQYTNFVWNGTKAVRMEPHHIDGPMSHLLDLKKLPMNTVVHDIPASFDIDVR